ncbi:MAG: TfoX/Sxy family DNA transformation protein [Parvularculaceae bacterium]
MTRVRDLLNLGPVMENRLAEVDITTAEQLARIGVVEAYARLKFAFGAAITLNALYAMDAALDGLDWRELPEERKTELRQAAGAAA